MGMKGTGVGGLVIDWVKGGEAEEELHTFGMRVVLYNLAPNWIVQEGPG
jgi:hypothetical protein